MGNNKNQKLNDDTFKDVSAGTISKRKKVIVEDIHYKVGDKVRIRDGYPTGTGFIEKIHKNEDSDSVFYDVNFSEAIIGNVPGSQLIGV